MSSTIGLQKAWRELSEDEVERLPGQLGVYQLADAEREIVFIGYAGGRSQFGLRSELRKWLEDDKDEAILFRYEVNMQYLTRYQELLMLFAAENGRYPRANAPTMPNLGRLTLG